MDYEICVERGKCKGEKIEEGEEERKVVRKFMK